MTPDEQHALDHEFIAELRTVLKFLRWILTINAGTLVIVIAALVTGQGK